MNEENLNNTNTSEKTEFDDVQIAEKPIVKVGAFLLELVKLVVFVAVTIIIVRNFLFKPYLVKGQSMEPTFLEKDYLIVEQVSYAFSEPKRGDVIVFRSPTQPKDSYLKRVVGLPGERVKVDNGKVIIFNEEHPEGIVFDDLFTPYNVPTTVVGEDQYYVLGDNRSASYDSRRFGPIDVDAIEGKAAIRAFPFDRASIFKRTDYAF